MCYCFLIHVHVEASSVPVSLEVELSKHIHGNTICREEPVNRNAYFRTEKADINMKRTLIIGGM